MELEEALRERMGELGDSEASRQHLELDLRVKDAYIEELRLTAARALDRQAALAGEVEEQLAAIARTEGMVADLMAQIARLRTELERYERLRYRVVDRLSGVLRRIPLLGRTAKALVRASLVVGRRFRRRRGSGEQLSG